MARKGLRTFVICAVVATLLLSITLAPRPSRAASGSTTVPSEVVVKLFNAGDLPVLAQDFALDPLPIDQIGSYALYRLRITDGSDPEVKAAALVADPQQRVIYAEANQIGQDAEGQARITWSSGGDAGVYGTQWAGQTIRLPEAHTVSTGYGITVAVLDTGVDMTHPMLAGHLVQGYDFVDNDPDPSEMGVYGVNHAFGHGTHVAGLVALVAPDAKIMPVRVLDPDGSGDTWTLVKGLAYAIDPDGNPATNDGASVINLSITMPVRSQLVRDVLRAITCPHDAGPGELPCFLPGKQGAVVAVAAGNSGSSVAQYPAAESIAGCLSVGASTEADKVASFSDWGSWVPVAAPGENILSTVPGGGYGTWSGTSMAAPLVAGEAALVRSHNPTLNTTSVVQQVASKGLSFGQQIKLRIDAAAALGLGNPK